MREYGDSDKFVPMSDPEVQAEIEDGYMNRFKTFKSMEDGCYECFAEKYTTPSGDKIVAFGYYGNDC